MENAGGDAGDDSGGDSGAQVGAQVGTGSMAASALRLSLFGSVWLWDAGGCEIVIANRRARALLAILALEPDRQLTREQVSKRLWPGRFEAQARASLRQCLLDLKKLLEPLGALSLAVTRDRIGVLAQTDCTDLDELEQVLADGRHDDATRLLVRIGAKPLLGDCSFGEPFADWIASRRLQVEQRAQSLVKGALADLEQRVLYGGTPQAGPRADR